MLTVKADEGVNTIKASLTVISNQITQAEIAAYNADYIGFEAEKDAWKDRVERIEQFRNRVLEMATGLTKDEWKLLNEKELKTLVSKRIAAGEVLLENGAISLLIEKSASQRNPAWKQIFIDAHSASEAEKILNETPTNYSYRVVPTPAAK